MKNVARALSNPDGLEVVGIMFVVGKNGLDFEPLQVRDKKNSNLILKIEYSVVELKTLI